MSSKVEAVGEGSPTGLSGAVEDGRNAALSQLMMHIVRTAISPENVLKPEAQLQIDLRDKGARGELLERLVLEVVPERINADLWLRWINGGASPFPKLEKVSLASQSPVRALTRTPARASAQRKKIDRLRDELEQEEMKLDYLEAHSKAAIQWHVVDQFLTIMGPAIAMGPAWTIMRALSAHISDEAANRMTSMLDEDDQEEGIRELRAMRKRETDEIFAELDFWSGHFEFENSLRLAIRSVIRNYEDVRPDWEKSGRRRRTRNEIMSSINPVVEDDMAEVLAGIG